MSQASRCSLFNLIAYRWVWCVPLCLDAASAVNWEQLITTQGILPWELQKSGQYVQSWGMMSIFTFLRNQCKLERWKAWLWSGSEHVHTTITFLEGGTMSFLSSWTYPSCPSLKTYLFPIIPLLRSEEVVLFFSDECLQSSAYSWVSQFYQVTSNYHASHHLECHYANLHMAWMLCLDKYLSSFKASLGKEYHTFCSPLSLHMYHDLKRSHSWREGLWKKTSGACREIPFRIL